MSTKDPSNKTLADRAQQNLTGPGISYGNTLGGHCAGFSRENVWQVYGSNSQYSSPAGLDAIDQFKWYDKRGLSLPVKDGSVVGDLLYKFGGAHGHVGIRIPGNRVAENSSVHGVGAQDARGIRTLDEFGKVEGIVRLPEPGAAVKPEPKQQTRALILGVNKADDAPVVNGVTLAPVRKWALWMGGQKLDWDPVGHPPIHLNGKPLNAPITTIGGDSYVSVRALVDLDPTLRVDYDAKTDSVIVSRVK